MPHAVTHILIPLILAELYRDHIAKKKFPIHYVLIAGIAGLLPDIDVIVFWILRLFSNITIGTVHRTFTHTLLFLGLFLILALVFKKTKCKFLSKYKLTLTGIFLAIAFGVFIHLFLDGTIIGLIRPLYPFSTFAIGLNLVGILPLALQESILPGIDAIILVLWLIHEEIHHKISKFY